MYTFAKTMETKMFGIDRKNFPKNLPRKQRLAYRAALNFYKLASRSFYANQKNESLKKSASYLREAGDEQRAKLVEQELISNESS